MSRRRSERGTVSIEVVILVPLLVLIALLTLQLGAAAWTVAQTQEAARQAARAQSLGQDPEEAARGALPGGIDLVDVDADAAAGRVTVRTGIPMIFGILPLDDVTRSATIRSTP
ncbi:TadE/TadG family type IV pilus assembly protein [Nocardioides sp. MH1]|uniref:TadE/TadG family type IV pilus assembly protein n=1 Tax=Nocardioides sp. MH1 TaxID=3242490 RepID=UPI0035203E2A